MSQVLEALRLARTACVTVFDQLVDDLFAKSLNDAQDLLLETAKQRRTIWLAGSDTGAALAVDVERQLTQSDSGYTRARVLGSAPSSRTTRRVKRHSPAELELTNNGDTGDCLWCFASDPNADEIIDVARAAKNMRLPVLVSTTFPGTPVIRFSSVTIKLVAAVGADMSASCVAAAHSTVATMLCSHIRLKMRALTRSEVKK